MPMKQTRSLAILSHRGVDTLRTGAAITLWPSCGDTHTDAVTASHRLDGTRQSSDVEVRQDVKGGPAQQNTRV